MHWKSDKEIEVDISMGDVVHFERFKMARTYFILILHLALYLYLQWNYLAGSLWGNL